MSLIFTSLLVARAAGLLNFERMAETFCGRETNMTQQKNFFFYEHYFKGVVDRYI